MEKEIVHAWIFARGGSKGLPGKNIKLLDEKPLIAHAIETARASSEIGEVFVSTDSEEIADVARRYGAVVPFLRPAELATDTAPERLAWRHAIQWNRSQTDYPRMQTMVSLPTTAPLRTPEEVAAALALFRTAQFDTVIAVSRSNRHPMFNMVCMDPDKLVHLMIPSKPGEAPAHRQTCPAAYDITTAVYVTSPDFVLINDAYMQGRVGAIEIPPEHGIDIDTPLDFKIAELLLQERKNTNA